MPPNEQEKLEFSSAVMQISETRYASYLEAILIHCKETDIEESVAATLLTDSLKSQIEYEARGLHLLKGAVNRLPL